MTPELLMYLIWLGIIPIGIFLSYLLNIDPGGWFFWIIFWPFTVPGYIILWVLYLGPKRLGQYLNKRM